MIKSIPATSYLAQEGPKGCWMLDGQKVKSFAQVGCARACSKTRSFVVAVVLHGMPLALDVFKKKPSIC